MVQRRPAELQAEVPTSVYALDLQRLSELLHIDQHELVSGFQAHNPTLSEMHGVVVDAGENVPFEAVGHIEHADAASAGMAPSSFEPIDRRSASFISVTAAASPVAVHEKVQPPLQLTPLTVPLASQPAMRRPLCKQVLLTAAARPSTLDSEELPKCLIQLGSQTIIAHILTQLYAAGIERVVISVAAGGTQIMQAVKRTPFYSKMAIEFLDLGADNRDGHARSILAARGFFPKGPFLIHTADHIFDKSIISRFMQFDLQENVACVLVETDVAGLVGLPATTVKVQVGKEKITKIGRELAKYDGIDAGLFVSSVAIFNALDELAAKKSHYFSLADALSFFTKYNKLAFAATQGETWFSIETEEQLAFTKDSDGVSVLSPWTVFLATTPAAIFREDPTLTKNVVIGISGVDQDATLRVAGSTDPRRMFDGFIVGVTNADLRDDEANEGHGDDDRSGDHPSDLESALPLLLSQRSPFVGSARSGVSLSRGTSFMEGSEMESSFVISFPMDDETSRTVDSQWAAFTPGSRQRHHQQQEQQHHAYLIEMAASNDPTTPAGSVGGSQFMLAVPGKEIQTPRSPSSLTMLHGEILPSDIQQISLETRGYDEHLEVTLVVTRRAPLIGYLLLLTSLLTVSSVGVALDIEEDVPPLLKLVWRQSGTCVVAAPLAWLSMRRSASGGGGSFTPLEVSRELVGIMVLTGLAYSFYLASYAISLEYTSVGHATLFNNTHSLLIVGVKLLMGQSVAAFEGAGAAIGVIGGAITAMDGTVTAVSEGSRSVTQASAYGDIIALAGALGGAAYFMLAKKLRARMDLVLFICCLTGISAVCLLTTLLLSGTHITLSTDANHGLFGWINPQADRLLIALYLVFVVDLIGTMGYISVMKYFDPIVISVVCLLEPIVANVMGIVAGVDGVPGVMTLFGALLVMGGTALVIMTQSHKTEQVDATDAIKSAMNATPKPLYSSRVKRRTFNYGSVN